MVAHEVYAMISGRDVMETVVGDYFNCNEIAKERYGKSAFAVEITLYPVQVGDHYLNGVFYRTDPETGENVEIERVPTEAEQIATLTAALNDVELALIDIYESEDEA